MTCRLHIKRLVGLKIGHFLWCVPDKVISAKHIFKFDISKLFPGVVIQ
jgi:hypothetical protein